MEQHTLSLGSSSSLNTEMGVECRVEVLLAWLHRVQVRSFQDHCHFCVRSHVVNRVLATDSEVVCCLARWSILLVHTRARASPPNSLTEVDCRWNPGKGTRKLRLSPYLASSCNVAYYT
ncbi:hypothetical protein E2C01_091627 [Portunus trituberculatus]|uniref:Uncharacterized protein n=1 Tax=Portunus trituberculatus TaxID=210409 RepID=A0A5B7JI04_PORTR|nr:hypothetical protein [Portunus trituberculatus]